MTALFLEPHADDAVLFGSFTLLREQPMVITVLESRVQLSRGTEITQPMRATESRAAMSELGCKWMQWGLDRGFGDDDPDWEMITERLKGGTKLYDRCYAPAVEIDGHDHHNAVGVAALAAFGVDRVIPYLTYTRTGGKSTWGKRVPFEPWMVTRKLRALACYTSQIESAAAGCTEHFLRDQHEYYAA